VAIPWRLLDLCNISYNKNMDKDAKKSTSVALYRKYRPEHFKEVLGQDHIVSALEGALKDDVVAHAYLFSGSRGTGKTSTARIFARAVGCSLKDIYEIDAASNRKIEHIREIRDAVSVLPFDSPYKVYIIDEVHMLTDPAFNALLKTLEEPPAHVLFMLATTEKRKLPDTIISRCQSFEFKKPSLRVLESMLQVVAKKEGMTLKPSVAHNLALLSDGSFRDALGMLQKVFYATDDNTIDVSDVERIAGVPQSSFVHDFITAIDTKDASKGLVVIDTVTKENIDMKVFCMMVINSIRTLLLLRHAPDMKSLLQERYSEEDFSFLESLSKDSKNSLTAKTLKELLSAYNDINFAAIATLPLELAFIKMCKKVE